IIIAATNRPDVLDPALLRPGRFDRQITVNLPDVKGREEILRVHSKKVKLAEGVDLQVVARGTPGYSGAELANVINEAALLAARRGLKGITLRELEEARDKVRWGKERRSMALSEKEKTNTAYHEAGHALLLELLPHTEPLTKSLLFRAVPRSVPPCGCRRKTNIPIARTSSLRGSRSVWAAASRRKLFSATSPTAPGATSNRPRPWLAGWFANGG